METLRKFHDSEIKVAEGEERTLWAVASTEDRDRDGDIIVQKSWKLTNFKKNPVILWAHNPSRPPIGKAVDLEVKDGKLKIKIQFVPKDVDPFAEQVFQLYKQGFMKTFSVGFIPFKAEPLTEDDKKQRPEMTWGRRLHAELLELSAVPVPSNPQALAQRDFAEAMVKGFTAKEPADPTGPESPLLPYRGADGAPDPRRVRACLAALLGARGGIPMPEAEKAASYASLGALARSYGAEAPEFKAYPQDQLREEFKDVWSDELLDIVTAAEEPEPPAPAEAEISEDGLKGLQQIVTDLGAVNALLKQEAIR